MLVDTICFSIILYTKRLCRVNTEWTPELAYVVGIIATDGNLSPDGRHINITSKDLEIVSTCKKCLGLENKIGKKARVRSEEKKYFVFQFGDINFYEFLTSIGLTRNKSKTIRSVNVPTKYLPDFLRGCIDGDGSIGISQHPESKHPQVKIRLVSASKEFVKWVLLSIKGVSNISGGHIHKLQKRSLHILAFGKSDSIQLLKLMYYRKSLPSLTRKRIIAEKILGEWRNW